MPDRHDVRRDIAGDGGVVADEGMRADLAELVHARETREDHVVPDLDMPRQRREIGEHAVITDHAVVRHMRRGHEEVVVTDLRHTLVVGGAAVDGDVLAEHVAVADLQPRRLASVFFVLRRIADRGELEHAVACTEPGPTRDHGMRSDDAAWPKLHIGPDHREGTDLHIGRELRALRHHRAWIDAHGAALPVSGATMSEAEATSASPTRATALNFQMPRICRCRVAVRISWSPGSTGRRKRASSIPTK